MSRTPLDTLNDRMWYAWHCLPRTPAGRPPPWKRLEIEHGIPLATFQKRATDERRSLDSETLVKVARALRVTTDWLSKGEGEPPKPTGPVQSRADRYALAQTLDTAVGKIEAAGGVGALDRRDNLETAIITLIEELHPETIAKVRAEARGIEDTRPPFYWGRILREEEAAYRARTAPPSQVRPQRRKRQSVAPTPKRRAS